MLIEVRFRGLEMTSEEMDTVRQKKGRSALIQQLEKRQIQIECDARVRSR